MVIMRRSLKRAHGFTIVELLIVIVVIAILATITVVAYNGIQKRAQTTLYVSAVDSIEKQMRMSAAIDPARMHTTEAVSIFCIGSTADYTARDGFSEGECMRRDEGDISIMTNDALYNQVFGDGSGFRSSHLPVVSLQLGSSDGTIQYGRGVVAYLTNTPDGEGFDVMLQLISPDQSTCGRGVGLYDGVAGMLEAVLRGDISPESAGLSPDISLDDLRASLTALKRMGDSCTYSFHS